MDSDDASGPVTISSASFVPAVCGSRASARASGATCGSDIPFEISDRTPGYAASQHFLSLDDPPTAIFAANDLAAFGVMDGILQRGLHVPEDISLIGFDDIWEAGHVHPGLTTVRPISSSG